MPSPEDVTRQLLVDKLANLQSELAVEGDPAKRTILKLQQISLEYELIKEKNDESTKDFHEPNVGGYD